MEAARNARNRELKAGALISRPFHLELIGLYALEYRTGNFLLTFLGVHIILFVSIGNETAFHQYTGHIGAGEDLQALLLHAKITPPLNAKGILNSRAQSYGAPQECFGVLGYYDLCLRIIFVQQPRLFDDCITVLTHRLRFLIVADRAEHEGLYPIHRRSMVT